MFGVTTVLCLGFSSEGDLGRRDREYAIAPMDQQFKLECSPDLAWLRFSGLTCARSMGEAETS